MKAALAGLTLCWRVAPRAPEVLISICLRGREAAPFAPIHCAPVNPEKFWRMCMHGIVCFRYNVCVDRWSAFFSWLSVEQATHFRVPAPLTWSPLYVDTSQPSGHGIRFGTSSDSPCPDGSSAKRNCENGRKPIMNMWAGSVIQLVSSQWLMNANLT